MLVQSKETSLFRFNCDDFPSLDAKPKAKPTTKAEAFDDALSYNAHTDTQDAAAVSFLANQVFQSRSTVIASYAQKVKARQEKESKKVASQPTTKLPEAEKKETHAALTKTSVPVPIDVQFEIFQKLQPTNSKNVFKIDVSDLANMVRFSQRRVSERTSQGLTNFQLRQSITKGWNGEPIRIVVFPSGLIEWSFDINTSLDNRRLLACKQIADQVNASVTQIFAEVTIIYCKSKTKYNYYVEFQRFAKQYYPEHIVKKVAGNFKKTFGGWVIARVFGRAEFKLSDIPQMWKTSEMFGYFNYPEFHESAEGKA